MSLHCSLTNWTLPGNSAQDCLQYPQSRFLSKYATASGDLVDEHSLSQYNLSFQGSSFANECATDIGSKET